MTLHGETGERGQEPERGAVAAWLHHRLVDRPWEGPEDPTQNRALIARSLAALFFGGASASVVWLLLPHTGASDDTWVWVATLGAYAQALVLIVGYDRLPTWALKLAVTMATIVITIAALANHENGSSYIIFYFWATIYAFAFFSLRQAALQTLLVALAFGFVVVSQQDVWSSEFARWLLVVGTTIVVGTLVRLLTGMLQQRSVYERDARLRAEAAERQARQIADVLQRSLLPPRLPEIHGVELGAAYRPGAEGFDVGGDFYDVFELPGGDWGLIIGDVRGKGPEAATVTSLVRHTVRAAAVRVSRPAAVLETVNSVMLRDSAEEELCTAIFGRLETGTPLRLVLAIGGHPLPVLLRAGGEAQATGASGTLLGVHDEPRLAETELELGPGDALILVTDGVQDSRMPDGRLGEARLVELVRECRGMSAAEIAARIEDAVAQAPVSGPGDDVAVLVVRAVPGQLEQPMAAVSGAGVTPDA